MAKITIKDRVLMKETLVSDGATGTWLQGHGLEPGDSPELFNLSNPKLITQMAREYFNAGSDMVLTNTFGGNKFMLTKYHQGGNVFEVNKAAAENSRNAVKNDSFQYVIGSVGPTGEFIEPLGSVSREQMKDVFIEQIEGMKSGGVDGILVETMFALDEAQVAVEAAKSLKVFVMATMTFTLGPRGFFTMTGVTPAQATKELEATGADVVGANCGNGIDNMILIAEMIRKSTTLPMLIHSNAGIPTLEKKDIKYPETPEYMKSRFCKLQEVGVDIIGGCCGTTPRHIQEMSKLIKNQGGENVYGTSK